jgi:N-methylhydantoinase B
MEIGLRGNSPWTLSAMYDRTRCPAQGLQGGSSGGLGAVRTSNGEPLHPKRQQRINGGEQVILSLPGGGGFGAAIEREPEMVARDASDGLVSVERARDIYKVVLVEDRSGQYMVDAEATTRLRPGAVTRSDGGS